MLVSRIWLIYLFELLKTHWWGVQKLQNAELTVFIALFNDLINESFVLRDSWHERLQIAFILQLKKNLNQFTRIRFDLNVFLYNILKTSCVGYRLLENAQLHFLELNQQFSAHLKWNYNVMDW